MSSSGSSRYRLLIFDWDGTLIDSIGAIVGCTQAALAELELPAVEEEKIRGVIGLGLRETVETICPGCSEKTFGHTGATGTLAWADPATDTICVVLTTLPGRAANPHPRKLASDLIAEAVG